MRTSTRPWTHSGGGWTPSRMAACNPPERKSPCSVAIAALIRAVHSRCNGLPSTKLASTALSTSRPYSRLIVSKLNSAPSGHNSSVSIAASFKLSDGSSGATRQRSRSCRHARGCGPWGVVSSARGCGPSGVVSSSRFGNVIALAGTLLSVINSFLSASSREATRAASLRAVGAWASFCMTGSSSRVTKGWLSTTLACSLPALAPSRSEWPSSRTRST